MSHDQLYELLRWLVETPSRDVEHYRCMFTASRPRVMFSTSGRHISMSHSLPCVICKMKCRIPLSPRNGGDTRTRTPHTRTIMSLDQLYELLRWLVETPSRDVEHYRCMFTASRPRVTFSTSGRHISMSHSLPCVICKMKCRIPLSPRNGGDTRTRAPRTRAIMSPSRPRFARRRRAPRPPRGRDYICNFPFLLRRGARVRAGRPGHAARPPTTHVQ